MTGKLTKEEKQAPFLISMVMSTSQMLGEFILKKLETTLAWVVPVYNDKPNLGLLIEEFRRLHQDCVSKEKHFAGMKAVRETWIERENKLKEEHESEIKRIREELYKTYLLAQKLRLMILWLRRSRQSKNG